MKYSTIIFLILIFTSCKEGVNTDSKAGMNSSTNEGKCSCPNHKKLVSSVEIKGKELLLCGILNEYANPSKDLYSLIEVFDCQQNLTISKVDESLSFKVSRKLDTLILKCFSEFPVGDNFSSMEICFFENVYYLENNAIISKYRYPADFPYYNQIQLEKVKKIYESFKQNPNNHSPSKEQSRINQFMGQLFVAAVSGDGDAKNRLFNFEKYYGTVLGAHEEILLEYIFLFNQAKGL